LLTIVPIELDADACSFAQASYSMTCRRPEPVHLVVLLRRPGCTALRFSALGTASIMSVRAVASYHHRRGARSRRRPGRAAELL